MSEPQPDRKQPASPSWEDDPFLRMLKEAALSLAPDLPDDVFSDDPAVQDRWLRDNGFPPADRGDGEGLAR